MNLKKTPPTAPCARRWSPRAHALTWSILAMLAGPLVAASEMRFPGAEWETASPASQGVDPAKLKAAIDHMDATFGRDGARELVIVRNGRLIWAGPDADAYHTIFSATKTFTSTLLGVLADDGKCSLDDPAVKYLPELDDHYPVYAKLKLRHLAAMCGGYRGEVTEKRPDLPWGEPMAYFNPRPPAFESGANVQYNDHDVFVLGKILTLLVREPLQDQFQRRIAGPIGIKKWEWGVSGSVDGITLNNPPGTPGGPGGGGIKMSPRDLARYGLLYLNRGNWNGRQLVSAAFVDEATSNRVPLTIGFRNRDFRGRYGFYWWTNGVMVDGKRPWPAAPPKTYMAHGHGGNFCVVVPEWNLVIARTGAGNAAGGADRAWAGFFAKLADAIPNPVAAPQAQAAPAPPSADDRVRRIGDWEIRRWAGLAVVADPRGDATHLVYRSEHTLHYTHSADHGRTWSPPALVVAAGMHPRLALDGAGTLHLVYCSARAKDKGDRLPNDGYYMQMRAGKWSEPVKLCQPAEGSLDVRIAVDGADNVHVIYWASGVNRGLGDHKAHSCYYRRKPAGGGEFEPALRIESSVEPGYSSHGDLAVGPQGEVHVFYRTYQIEPKWTGNLEHRIREKDETWRGEPVAYRGVYVPDHALSALVDARGNLYLAAYTFRPRGFKFQCYRQAPQGELQPVFVDDETYGTSTDIAATSAGDLWLVGAGNWSPKSRSGTAQSRIYHLDAASKKWSEQPLSADGTVNVDIFCEGPRLLQYGDEVHVFYAEKGADGKFRLYQRRLTGPLPGGEARQ